MKEIFKKFYRAIPFKKQFYSLLKLLWLPPHSVYKHLHFEDTFSVVTENRTFKIRHYGYEVENGLFWRGVEQCWEGTSLELWKELCKESRIILDIGANTGVYSLIAQTINPNAKVYAFEPLKQVCEKLRSNCQLNGYDIACLEVAVSNYKWPFRIMTEKLKSICLQWNMFTLLR